MARNKLDGGLLTYKQAADYLSISKSTLYCMVSRRMLPVIRFVVGPGMGGNTRFRLCDLDSALIRWIKMISRKKILLHYSRWKLNDFRSKMSTESTRER